MKRYAYSLLLLTAPLGAQTIYNQAFTPPVCSSFITTVSAGIGYRRDRQRFEQPEMSRFYLNGLDSLQTTVVVTTAWDRVILKLAGDYGWLLDGTLPFKSLGSPFLSQEVFPSLHMGSGYTADIQPSIACRVIFWKFCPGSLSFIPLLGYNYSHFNASPRGQTRVTPPGAIGFTAMEFIRPIQQDWYGPFFEGRIAFSWREQFRVDFFYQYHHLDFRETYSQSVSNYFFSAPNTLSTVDTSTIRSSSKSDTLRTQLGGADISYRSCRQWQLGAHFEGSSTWTNTAKAKVRVKRNFFLPINTFTNTVSTQKLTVYWVRYIVNCYASYWF